MAVSQCKIDFDVDDDPGSIRTFPERIEHAVQSDPIADVIVDLSKCECLGPDAVTVFAAVHRDLARQSRRLTIHPPVGPPSLRTFFDWSGLEAVVAERSPPDAQLGEDFNVLPIRTFVSANLLAPEPIVGIVRSRLRASEEWQEYLAICVNEVMQNIQDHSQSPIGGLMSAKFTAEAKELRVAIVDRGLGVCATLKGRFPDTTPENALKRVIEGRYTALSRQNNAGLGINHLKSIVQILGGHLYMVSWESEFALNPERQHYNVLPFQFRGTGVFFSLHVRED